VLGVLLVCFGAVLFPFLLAAANSIKSGVDYALHGPLALPQSFDLTSLIEFWNDVDFSRKLLNSAIISGCAALGAVFLGLLNAYAIGVGRVRGRRLILALILVAIMVPQESLIFPLYYMSKPVGLYNSIGGVAIIFAILQSAFATYLLSSVMTALPRDIIEAAEIDGASRWQALWLVIVPMLRPTLGVLITFFFLWTWNEFLIPLVFLPSNDNQTVALALGILQGQHGSEPSRVAAASLLGMAPTVIFFLIFQRTLTRGLVVGAVK